MNFCPRTQTQAEVLLGFRYFSLHNHVIQFFVINLIHTHKHTHTRAYQVAQWIKNLPAMQKTQELQVQSLGREDPLEKGMASHSSILACRIPWREEFAGYGL